MHQQCQESNCGAAQNIYQTSDPHHPGVALPTVSPLVLSTGGTNDTLGPDPSRQADAVSTIRYAQQAISVLTAGCGNDRRQGRAGPSDPSAFGAGEWHQTVRSGTVRSPASATLRFDVTVPGATCPWNR
jgi:hypothetical protein